MKINIPKPTITNLAVVLTFSLMISCSDDRARLDVPDESYLNIPDVQFESILIELDIDSDGTINHKMLRSDAEKISRLDLNRSTSSEKIADLSGIEGFVNLTYLSAAGQEIRDVDLSFNTKLDTLFLYANHLTTIDIGNNTELIFVDAQSNELSEIRGLSRAKNLKKLNLSFNSFEAINIDNESVEVLMISHNLLDSIDVREAKSLKNLLIILNQLTALDVSSNRSLETLIMSGNSVKNLILGKNFNLTHLYCSSNILRSLDVSNNLRLVDLRVDKNPDLTCIQIRTNQVIPSVLLSDYQQLNTKCN